MNPRINRRRRDENDPKSAGGRRLPWFIAFIVQSRSLSERKIPEATSVSVYNISAPVRMRQGAEHHGPSQHKIGVTEALASG